MRGPLSSSTVAIASLLFTIACGSTTAIPIEQSRVLVGSDNQVRVHAQIMSEQFNPRSAFAVSYRIENLRDRPIAVAELSPAVSYDLDSRTMTVNLGAEIPGQGALPRLVEILPGETRTFQSAGRSVGLSSQIQAPRYIRVRLNFLHDSQPFRPLLEPVSPAPMPDSLEDSLFALWIEGNESVVTNSIPIHWSGSRGQSGAASAGAPATYDRTSPFSH